MRIHYWQPADGEQPSAPTERRGAPTGAGSRDWRVLGRQVLDLARSRSSRTPKSGRATLRVIRREEDA